MQMIPPRTSAKRRSRNKLVFLPLIIISLWGVSCTSSAQLQSDQPLAGPSSNSASLLACAGPDQFVRRANPVRLNASCSRIISQEQQQHFLWMQVSGPSVSIQSPTKPQSLFFAPLNAAQLDFSLTLQAPRLYSHDTSKIYVLSSDTDPNALTTPPLALSQGDILLDEGQVHVRLDASRSTAFSKNIQTVRWSQLLGPRAQLVDADKLVCSATFMQAIDLAVFSVLIENSNGLWSAPEFVVVRSRDQDFSLPSPGSLTGPSYVQSGETVQLYVSEVPQMDTDISQNLLQLRGDPVILEQSTEEELRFIAPKRPQTLVFRLDRDRLGLRSAPAISVIRVSPGLGNHAPIAKAGPDRTVGTEQGLVLDASHSYDPDREAIQSYHWTQILGPSMTLDCEQQRCLTISPAHGDVAVFSLVVSDGRTESEPDILAITIDPNAENQPPIADAGGERWGLPGHEILLDGSLSFDPDSGHIETWTWQQIEDDAARATVLQGISSSQLFIRTPDESGHLGFQLTVCDEEQACDTSTMTLHIDAAGPYVDVQRGSEQGRGTIEAPYADLNQALLWSQRFGIEELRLSVGQYTLSDSLVLTPGFLICGGFQFADATYSRTDDQRSQIIVPGLSAITLSSGASLKDLDISAKMATASADERQLIVLQADNLLQNIHATGPANALNSSTIVLQAAASAQIMTCDLQGGEARDKSFVIKQLQGSSLTISETELQLGQAQKSVGLHMEDAELQANNLSVKNLPESEGENRIGIDLLRGHADFLQLDVKLSAETVSDTPSHVSGLRCQSCSFSSDENSRVEGAGPLATGGASFGLDLQDPVDANISGIFVGGSGESAEQYTALRLQGGRAAIHEATLIAAKTPGESSLGVGLFADNTQVIMTNSQVQAQSQQRAIGLALCNMPNPQLDLKQISVAATIATGFSDGQNPYTEQNCPGSSQLHLSIQQQNQVIGTSDCQGIALRGSNFADIQLGQILVNGVHQAQAINLIDCGPVYLHDGQLHLASALYEGRSTGISCASTNSLPTEITVKRVSSINQGEVAFGISAPSCNISLTNSFFSVDAEHLASCVYSGGNIAINNSDLVARGDEAILLQDDSSGHVSSLRNSLLWIQANSGSVIQSEQDLQHIENANNLIILRNGLPMYSQTNQANIEDSATLINLRPTFYSFDEIDDPELLMLDASGHITSPTSILVDAAETRSAAVLDIDGEQRPKGAAPDIGADEAY